MRQLRWLMPLGVLPWLGDAAFAACSFTPSSGDDAYVCDSGIAASLSDTIGNNSLLMPAGGTGSITGDVTFGPGRDQVHIDSGTITGNVGQGDGIDTFVMNGGQIQSLTQGDGLDRFFMSGGRIVGAFEDGDYAIMTGGRIGRVNMKLDDNLFDMSGGSIDGNLVAGFGNDTILLSNGRIGGNISVSGGADSVTLSGGEVAGDVLLSFGNDRFIWKDGGVIRGSVQTGPDDDQALLINLDETHLATARRMDGGDGNDHLIFDNSSPEGGARYVGWEIVSLNNGSVLTLNDTLLLGDANSATGVLNIDPSSQLLSRSGAIAPMTAGHPATLNNAGLIDLSDGGDAAGRLTLTGDYVGHDGLLRLNSVLASDAASSDRLIVRQGRLSGTTTLQVNNLNGIGAHTRQNGIHVIEAADGATSSASAFRLGSSLSAGAYEYYLFKGGVTAGSENSWYLRSSVIAPATTAVRGETPPALAVPVAAPGTPALPTAIAGESIPLYRAEVPLYAAASRSAALLPRLTLSTFHERQGAQNLFNETGPIAAGWARGFGDQLRQQWSGTVSPSLNGDLRGYQVGHDLFAALDSDGYRQHLGLYLGHARLKGSISGFALGFDDNQVGDVRLDGDSIGAYWTLIGPQQWYLDTVLQYTELDGRTRSDRGVALDLSGHTITGSLESGFPLALNSRWVLEPQAQLIVQSVSLRSATDGISRISYDNQSDLTARVGARLKGQYLAGHVPVQPYLRSNVWQTLGGRDSVSFDADEAIKTEHNSTWMDIGAGLTAQPSPALSVYANLEYGYNLDSRQQEQVGASLGLRVSW
uniref:autotransporter family protein n=1 Tax=Pseudomonas laurentiana TaxID=2364649 RepID=UPI0029C67139|nr:autotransporter outer membrane beta-barrel domain-containing protein [Pseudomonas laurentiana]